MRIVVLGDFHLDAQSYDETISAMKDIAACSPDLVIPLGDFGSKGKIGTVEGLHESKKILDLIGAPLRPILGNHDLERESGDGPQIKGTIENEFKSIYELESTYGVIEYEDFRLFFVSTEPQPVDSCYSVQECYATDEQFDFILQKLKERPGIPAIFFTHAPPIGCGLRTVPTIHVRSTNAYLDQNHNPYRWKELYETFPEIIMWFSAHYHLGHTHIDSHTIRSGTHFFMTGVHSRFTRDEMRQSRVIDVSEEGIHVATLDHVDRKIIDEGGFKHNDLNSLVQPISTRVKDQLHGLQKLSVFSVGDDRAQNGGIVPVNNERVIVSTVSGFSWEVHLDTEAVMGTLHIGEPLKAAVISDDTFWLVWDHYIGTSDPNDIWRFVRRVTDPWPMLKTKLPNAALCMTPHPDGGVWIATASYVYHLKTIEEIENEMKPIVTLLERPKQMICEDNLLFILSENGDVLKWDGASQQKIMEREQNIISFDVLQEQFTALTINNNQLYAVVYNKDGKSHSVLLEENIEHSSIYLSTSRIIYLRDQNVLIMFDGRVFVWDLVHDRLQPLSQEEGRATDIARIPALDHVDRFVITRSADNQHHSPRMEVYGY